jgi:hypothetical protein
MRHTATRHGYVKGKDTRMQLQQPALSLLEHQLEGNYTRQTNCKQAAAAL